MLDIYNSFSDFTIFYVIATVTVVLGIIFNNELCYIEDKISECWHSRKNSNSRNK